MLGVRMLAPVCAFAGLPIRGAHAQDVAPGPAGLPGGGAATTCTPALDTLRDTMFVALTPVRLRDAIPSAALIPGSA